MSLRSKNLAKYHKQVAEDPAFKILGSYDLSMNDYKNYTNDVLYRAIKLFNFTVEDFKKDPLIYH